MLDTNISFSFLSSLNNFRHKQSKVLLVLIFSTWLPEKRSSKSFWFGIIQFIGNRLNIIICVKYILIIIIKIRRFSIRVIKFFKIRQLFQLNHFKPRIITAWVAWVIPIASGSPVSVFIQPILAFFNLRPALWIGRQSEQNLACRNFKVVEISAQSVVDV